MQLDHSVFISIGERENQGGPHDMVGDMHKMASILRGGSYPKLRVVAHEFEGETHQSVIPAAYSRGMRALFR